MTGVVWFTRNSPSKQKLAINQNNNSITHILNKKHLD